MLDFDFSSTMISVIRNSWIRNIVVFLILLCVLLVDILVRSYIQNGAHNVQTSFSYVPQEDCRYVYLDLGSNKGVQIRKLFEPALYPGAKVLPYFDKIFGNVEQRRKYACAFGFEANPRHFTRLKYIENAYKRKGFRVTFYNNAVSNEQNKNVTIYSETNFDLDWGAGILDVAIKDKESMTRYEIPTVDIVQFINKEIKPLNPKAVFVKMDIEGSEYTVLPHMVKNKVLCKNVLTSMVVEMHKWAKEQMKSELDLKTLRQTMKQQICAPTEIVPVDDETYKDDVDVDPGA